MGDLWTCPDCRRSFANRNQWHSCTDLSLDDYLAGRPQLTRDIYLAVQEALATCGDFRIHAQKTRVAFINRMTFAGLRLLASAGDASFILPVPLDSERVTGIDLYGPASFRHTVRISSPAEVDEEMREWLCRAWLRGTQETLDPNTTVARVSGWARQVLTIPLATRVVSSEDELTLTLPDYAWRALGDESRATARVPNHEPIDAVVKPGRLLLATGVLRELGLGEGDPTDLVLRPRD